MGGSPDAHHRHRSQRCQMHIGRVHRHHHIQMTHDNELLIHVLTIECGIETLAILGTPHIKIFIFIVTLAKKENTTLGIFLQQLVNHLLHQSRWIYFTFVGCKGRNAYPLFKVLLRPNLLGKQIQVAALFGEDGMELLDINRIA